MCNDDSGILYHSISAFCDLHRGGWLFLLLLHVKLQWLNPYLLHSADILYKWYFFLHFLAMPFGPYLDLNNISCYLIFLQYIEQKILISIHCIRHGFFKKETNTTWFLIKDNQYLTTKIRSQAFCNFCSGSEFVTPTKTIFR